MNSIISDQIEVVEFEEGEILFAEGEESFHFYILQEGEVEIHKKSVAGETIHLARVGPGSSLGEFAMIDHKPRSATATALSRITAVKVSDEAYQRLLADLPEWAISVMRSLVERLRQTNEILSQSGISDPRLKRQIEIVEYDAESASVVEENPFLSHPDDDDFSR